MAVVLSGVCLSAGAGAQTQPSPPPSPWGAAPPPLSPPPGAPDAPPAAQAPPPVWDPFAGQRGPVPGAALSPGALQVAPMQPAAPPVMRCSRGGSSTRFVAELGVGFATYMGSLMIPLAAAGAFDDDGPERISGATIGTMFLGALVLSPLAVYWVGQALGGDGNVWGAVVGNLLGGPIGSPIGYELTTAPECPPGVVAEREVRVAEGRTPHPRVRAWTGPRALPALRLEGVGLRF